MAAKKAAKAAKKTAKKAANKAAKKRVASTRDMTELVDLTPEAMRALGKPREGFEEHVEPLLHVWETHQDKLGVLAMGVDETRERLARYRELEPAVVAARAEVAAAEKKLEMVLETRALQASKVWGAMLDIYGKGKQAGKTDAQIADEIKPFMAFMATGPRKNGDN